MYDAFQIDSLGSVPSDGDKIIVISPNPSFGNINLSSNQPSEVKELRIFDSVGRMAFRSVTRGWSNVNFELWPEGLYYFNFTFKDGEEVVHEVIFK